MALRCMIMKDHEHLPVAPSLEPSILAADITEETPLIDKRVVLISVLAVGVAIASGYIAQILVRLIGLVTNIAFYGRVSTDFVSPADNHFGLAVIAVPII